MFYVNLYCLEQLFAISTVYVFLLCCCYRCEKLYLFSLKFFLHFAVITMLFIAALQ